MLVAEGRLALEGGAYHPVGDLTTVAVPETLTALIASRLDALEPGERAVVSDAAVLGQSFTLAGLSAVSGTPDADLEPMLRHLVQRELLTQEVDPRSPERGQYSFVQALIREVAYNTLARRDRKTRHLAAARFFESLGSDELAGALASHYLSAQQNASEPAEADALAGQARIALRGAADRAIALGSYEQALGFLRMALMVATDPAEEADLLERFGRAANESAHLEEAETMLRRAIELRRELGDPSVLATTIVLLARTLTVGYRSVEAIELLEPAMAELSGVADEEAVIRLGSALSSAYAAHQEPEQALRLSDEYIGRAERLDLVDVVIDLIQRRGMVLGGLGRTYESMALTKGALELAESRGFVDKAMVCRSNLGFHLTERDPAQALAMDRETLTETRRLGMRTRMLLVLGNASEEARYTGDWDWAIGELEAQLIGELDRMDRAWYLGNTLVFRAWRGEAIDDDWATWEALTEVDNDPQSLADYADVRALRALADGRLADARRLSIESNDMVASRTPSRLAVAARASLWSRDRDGAVAGLAALDLHRDARPRHRASAPDDPCRDRRAGGADRRVGRDVPPGTRGLARSRGALGRGAHRDRHGDPARPARARGPGRRHPHARDPGPPPGSAIPRATGGRARGGRTAGGSAGRRDKRANDRLSRSSRRFRPARAPGVALRSVRGARAATAGRPRPASAGRHCWCGPAARSSHRAPAG